MHEVRIAGAVGSLDLDFGFRDFGGRRDRGQHCGQCRAETQGAEPAARELVAAKNIVIRIALAHERPLRPKNGGNGF
jgi:hypothetical protein